MISRIANPGDTIVVTAQEHPYVGREFVVIECPEEFENWGTNKTWIVLGWITSDVYEITKRAGERQQMAQDKEVVFTNPDLEERVRKSRDSLLDNFFS